MNLVRIVEAEANAACRVCGSISHKQDLLFHEGTGSPRDTKSPRLKPTRAARDSQELCGSLMTGLREKAVATGKRWALRNLGRDVAQNVFGTRFQR